MESTRKSMVIYDVMANSSVCQIHPYLTFDSKNLFAL